MIIAIISSGYQNTRIKMPSRITAIVNKKNDIVFNLEPKDTIILYSRQQKKPLFWSGFLKK